MKHRYLHVRETLRKQVVQLCHGEKMPPERTLSESLGVARTTVRRALRDLEQEGCLIRRQGLGTFAYKARTLTESVASDTQHEPMIALILPDVEIRFFARILKGVQLEAEQQGYKVLVCTSEVDAHREKKLLRRLAKMPLAGLLSVPTCLNVTDEGYNRLVHQIRQQGMAMVAIEQYLPRAGVSSAVIDHVHKGYIATEHLIMLGHERIAYVSTRGHTPIGDASSCGYRRALNEYGLCYDPLLSIDLAPQYCADPARLAVKQLLGQGKNKVTAIATHTLSMTYAIMQALDDLGLRVPEDVAVVGNDVYCNSALAHVTHTLGPAQELGQAAARLLLSPPVDEVLKKHVLLKSKLVVRQTCNSSDLEQTLPTDELEEVVIGL